MPSLEEKVIYLNKIKIIFLILLSIIFVALGAWMLSLDVQSIESSSKNNNPIFVYGLGIASIVFFGSCGFVGFKKLFEKSPGLTLNSEGILDNSSGFSSRMIPWTEVANIGEHQVQKQKFVSIHVQDPEKYVNTGNVLKRISNRANIKMCGTPINISANSLKIGYEELLEVIQKYYRNSRSDV